MLTVLLKMTPRRKCPLNGKVLKTKTSQCNKIILLTVLLVTPNNWWSNWHLFIDPSFNKSYQKQKNTVRLSRPEKYSRPKRCIISPPLWCSRNKETPPLSYTTFPNQIPSQTPHCCSGTPGNSWLSPQGLAPLWCSGLPQPGSHGLAEHSRPGPQGTPYSPPGSHMGSAEPRGAGRITLSALKCSQAGR